jgi:hypothetical protein
MREFYEEPKFASHTKIVKLFKKLQAIEDVLDLDSEFIVDVFKNAISPQLPLFTDLSEVVMISQIAFEIGVKDESFWASISHTIATNYEDMDIDKVINLIYFLYRNNPASKIWVNKNYIEGTDIKKERVFIKLSYDKIIGDLQSEIELNLSEIESSTAFTILDLSKILFLSNVIKLDLLLDSFSEEKLMLHLHNCISGFGSEGLEMKEESEVIDEYIDSLNQFTKDFKLIHLFDLLQLITNFKHTLGDKNDLLKFIIYQFLENIKNSEFYKGTGNNGK